MFNRRIQNNKQDLTLFKGRNQCNKVLKEMNEPPKEYEAIKALVEEKNKDFTNNSLTNNSLTNNINIKSKNNIQIQSHNKLKK